MAQVKDDLPSTQADQGSLHVLQLFDFSYTVLTFDERLILYLRTAERANEQIQSARVLLRGLGAEVSIPKKKSMEKTISETEYHARILAQDLDPAKSESSSPQDIIKQSRLFLILRSDNHEVSKDLESLYNACIALDNIIESCKSVRVNSIKRKPLHSTITPSSQTSQTSPVTSPPANKVDVANGEQPSTSQQTEDFLAGLPPLDAARLLHHRRTSRLRNRSNNQLAQTSEGQPQQPTNDPANTFELPGWSPIPIPQPTARGYVFIPTLTTMPELEAPSEIISVTKVKSDYANDLRSPILEPGVHRVEGNDGGVNKGASKGNSQSTEPVATLSQSLDQPQPPISDSKGPNGPNVPPPSLDTTNPLQGVASPHANLAPPRNSIVEESESEAKKVASHQSSTISEHPQSLVSSAHGDDSSIAAITPPTSKSSRVSESVVGKSSSTRNRLRKAPFALATKAANIFLADSPGPTQNSIASKLSSEQHEPRKSSTKPPPTQSNQSSKTTIREVPSVSVKTQHLPEKGSIQSSVQTLPSTAQDANQTTTYTPTLTSSPQYQTSKSFTIVSPPVSPSREAFQKEYENAKRLSITSTISAPPSTSHPPAKYLQSAYSTQQQINDAHKSRLLLEQNRTYSLPEITQHRKTMSVDELWLPQRSQTNPPDTNHLQTGVYSSKSAKDLRDERIASPSNVPNTSVARAPIPPYPVTPIQGPVRFSHHEPMPSASTKLPFPPIPGPSRQLQPQDPRTQQSSVSSTTVPSTSYQGSFHFQTPQHITPSGAGSLPTADSDPQRSFHSHSHSHSQSQPQPQPQSQLLQHAPSRSHTAPISMQQHLVQNSQSQANHQSVRFPQLQRQPPPHLQQQQPQPQQQRANTLPTPAPTQAAAPPLPPKITHPHPSTIILEGDLGRERSVSGTKSTISSRSSTLGLQSPQQQQQHPMNFRSTTSSTLSVGVGIVGDGGGGAAGGGGSSNNSTSGAGPAVGMARKRSSWLTRQVERAGLKSF